MSTKEMNLTQKEARTLCWKGRDDYFQCLENNKENASQCLHI